MTASVKEWQPMEFAVCIGFDALRIATFREPRHFSVDEVCRWLKHVSVRDRSAKRRDAIAARPERREPDGEAGTHDDGPEAVAAGIGAK